MIAEGPSRDEVVKAAFQYRDALKSHALAILRDWSLAEDVVQDAFIVVMNKWQEFEPGTNLYSWIRRIVHNKSLEALRARRDPAPLDRALIDQVAGAVQEHLDEGAARRQRAMREALQHCMAFLNRKGVEILSRFYAGSESCEDIAAAHGRSVNAVRLVLTRIRRRLHDCMMRRLAAEEVRG